MGKELTLEYKSVKIVFDANTVRWEAEIDGVERSREKLSELKRLIDAPPKESFSPCSAFLWFSGNEPSRVKVTSKAERSYYGDRYRLSTGRIEPARSLYQDTTGNAKLFDELAKLNEEMREVRARYDAKVKLLEPFKP